MKEFGIDISKWQGDFNFDLAIKEGVKFAIIKGGGGDAGLYVDGKFVKNYTKAKEKNLPVGVYWFSKAVTVATAKAEAEYFYENVLKGRKFELPIYMDVEHKEQLKLGKQALTQIIKAWCEYLEEKGYYVGIYSSLAYFKNYMNDSELQCYAHWIAQWHTECQYNGEYGMWQFGGESNPIRTNKVAGVVCDQDYMLVDYPTIIKNGGLNGFTKEPPKTVTQIAKEVLAGKWGNGTDRTKRLTEAGYNAAEVQAKVNELLKKPKAVTLKVGDKVKLLGGATYTNGKKVPTWVTKMNLYVRKINGDKITVSILKVGLVTGVVDKKYLKKI